MRLMLLVRSIIFNVLLMIILPASAVIEGYDPVRAAFQDGRYQEVLDLLEDPMMESTPERKYYLAKIYEYGVGGVAKDYSIALRAFEEAAEAGHVEAQARLGLLYETGTAWPRDYAKSFYWNQKAAANDHTDAQKNLGFAYELGYGTEKDETLAIYWYLKAAQKGSIKSQRNMGRLQLLGIIENRDVPQGLQWIKLAAEQNDSKSQFLLANYYAERLNEFEKVEAYFWYRLASETFSNEEFKKIAAERAAKLKPLISVATELAINARLSLWDKDHRPNYIVDKYQLTPLE